MLALGLAFRGLRQRPDHKKLQFASLSVAGPATLRYEVSVSYVQRNSSTLERMVEHIKNQADQADVFGLGPHLWAD